MGRPFPDHTALDRALERLPRSGERECMIELLLDDAYEDGTWPRYTEFQTVGDVRTLGVPGLVEIAGMDTQDATWLVKALGGAKPGRKKGSKRKGKRHGKRKAQTASEAETETKTNGILNEGFDELRRQSFERLRQEGTHGPLLDGYHTCEEVVEAYVAEKPKLDLTPAFGEIGENAIGSKDD